MGEDAARIEAEMAGPDAPPVENEDFSRVYWTFSVIALLGLCAAAAYAASTGSLAVIGAILGAAVLVAGASGLVGGLAGLLFAIPRSRQERDSLMSRSESGRHLSDYSANTNLEQISDWLTKVLLGAGLVQLGHIPTLFSALAGALAPALRIANKPEMAQPVALSLMVYFLPWGFLFGYVITRLWLPKALSRAEGEEAARHRQLEAHTVESRAYKALYEAPPAGFLTAINTIEEYFRKPGAHRTAWLWAYLACAYGQQHKYETDRGNHGEATRVEAHVLLAARNAISLSPSIRGVLVGNFQGVNPNENDLASLHANEELARLLADPPE